MKAITIKQPWASLIVSGLKDIENRTWSCPKKYLGKRVLIHAAKTSVKEGWSALNGMQIKKVSKHKDKLYGDNEDLPKGCNHRQCRDSRLRSESPLAMGRKGRVELGAG